MSKFASLLGRKPAIAAVTQEGAPAAAPDKDVLELDQDLFFPIATQLGEENELVRNLLMDAEHKIVELDTIKNSLGRLVDPISKTLRAFEEAKSEKLSLQSVLNNTRIAYSKLRDDLTTAERKVATLDSECIRLREVLTVAQQSVTALETTKSEQSAELSARRAQISELQRVVQQQSADLQASREECTRNTERAMLADKRAAHYELDAQTASQKFQLADRERAAVQGLLDKALNDSAQMSRRLLDMEKSLVATQARLKKVESSLAETQAERIRLATALEDANETLRKETIAHNARFEALRARSQLSDKLLEESRQALAARSDEINAFDRRLNEVTVSRSAIEIKFEQMETALAERDAQIRALEEAQANFNDRNADLIRAVSTRENAYNRAQEKIQAQDDLIQMLESQVKASRESADLQIEELKSQLQREQLDKSMAEGALEAGRKDIARLLRELATMQSRPGTTQDANLPPAPKLRVQNAA